MKSTPVSIIDFPDELLEKIIRSLNQKDLIQLALTHPRFSNICQLSLLRRIYIYNDDKHFKFTKKATYIQEYLHMTTVGLSNFLKLLTSPNFQPSLTKEIVIANDDNAYLQYFELMERQQLPVKFDRIKDIDVRNWLREVKPSRKTKLAMELAELKRRSQFVADINRNKTDYYDSNDQFIVVITIIFVFVGVLVFIVMWGNKWDLQMMNSFLTGSIPFGISKIENAKKLFASLF
ncbi:hypothetical protein MEQ_00474 [Candida albicans P87]|nr:hypothetical protein MEQ_00474 [Candida albicans P87]